MTRTNKILISVVALGLAVCAYYFLNLAPKREEIAKLDTKVTQKQAEVAQGQQTLVTYEAARKGYKHNYALLARLGKAVPADDDVRSLLIQLESAADRSGIEFAKIELGSSVSGTAAAGATPATAGAGSTGTELASAPGAVPVAGGALSAMPFNFSFTGGYFDLSNFFAKLEHFVTVNNKRIGVTGRLLRLESVSITPAASGFPEMQAAIGAATYLVPPVEGVPGAAAPGAAQAAGTTPATPGTTPPPTTTANAGAAQ
jgi:Tfp pilus assembly protein PilO